MRVIALEEHAGIRRAYCDEVEAAAESRKIWRGGLATNIQWPGVDRLARWRRAHWAEWSAQWESIAADYSARIGRGNGLDYHQALDQFWHRTSNKLWEQRPYLPPPEGDDLDLAYWADSKLWRPCENDYFPDEEEENAVP
jgi:hypothetical protein